MSERRSNISFICFENNIKTKQLIPCMYTLHSHMYIQYSAVKI